MMKRSELAKEVVDHLQIREVIIQDMAEDFNDGDYQKYISMQGVFYKKGGKS